MAIKIVLLSIHYYKSDRRAGFHWLADAFARAGHQVCFVTVGFSFASYLRRDHRIFYPEIWAERNRLIQVADNLTSYVHFTPWHPVNLVFPWLNSLSDWVGPWYARQSVGEADNVLRQADLVLYESSFGLYLFSRIKKLNPNALHVYRVSDDVRLLRMPHPGLQSLECEIVPEFDLLSVPCEGLALKFHDFSRDVAVKVHRHGIARHLFSRHSANPYGNKSKIHAVFVGAGWLDENFLKIASAARPDIEFHVIGPFNENVKSDNIVYHGEMKFIDTIPYIRHADIGLHVIVYRPGSEVFTDTLKVLQYCECCLPIIVPEFVKSVRTNMFYYTPGDYESILSAINAACAHGKHDDGGIPIHSWDEVASSILKSIAL